MIRLESNLRRKITQKNQNTKWDSNISFNTISFNTKAVKQSM